MKKFLLSFAYFFIFIYNKLTGKKFAILRDERIGHLLANTEYWLRKNSLLKIKSDKVRSTLFISSNSPCNGAALNTLSNHIHVIRSSFLKKLILKLKSNYPGSPLWECQDENGYNDPITWQQVPPQMEIDNNSKTKGSDFLEKMKIRKEFVCVFSRDTNYLKKSSPNQNWDYHNYRDADFINYKDSLEYLNSKGIQTLRVGSTPSPAPPELEGKFIDYASNFRTEELDLYLGRSCKFFLGDTSGVYYFSQTFNIPCLLVNLIPQGVSTYLLHDLFIPKKLWSKEKNRYLKFKELYGLGAHLWHRSEDFSNSDIECHQNSPKEILKATEEMNNRIDGSFKYNGNLYDRYYSSIQNVFPQAKNYAPIAQSFLELNIDLLE